MSLFTDASLVMIPSGIKDQKIYSVTPTDGSGDLTFTRSNDTATRVASNGLIEKVRTNLYTYSQSFANAAWLAVDVTKVSTSATDPNGGTTAANITWTSGSGRYFYQNEGMSSTATVSIWVKSNGGGNSFRLFANGGTSFSSNLTATSTWTRYSFAFAGTGSVGIGISNASDNSAADLLVAFAQLETGDIATDYIVTTTAAVSVGPVANLPRLDYSGGATCPKLLLEGQRTNLIPFSESFDNAVWGDAGITITANQAVSPDGYTNADLAVNSSSTNYLYQGAGASPISGTYTASIFAKKGTQSSFAFGLVAGGFTGGMGVKFNFDTQTFSTPTNYANFTSISASYQSYGNGWYRLNLTGTTATSTNYFFVLGSLQESFPINAYVYGCQVEEGAYGTSYINTLGAVLTRGADSASKTGIASLIGQSEGVLFIDFVASAQNADGAGFSLITAFGDANENFQLYAFGTTLYWYAWKTTVRIDETANQTLVAGQRYKIAYAYKSGDWALYINGVQKRTNAETNVPAVSQFNLSATGLGVSPVTAKNEYNQILVFPTRLSNDDLAALTA